MVGSCDVFIITKDAGTLLSKFSLLGEENARDQLISGFLTALNSFSKEIGFPKGVSLLRSGNKEARFVSGEYIITVLIIDYVRPLDSMTEPLVSGLAGDIARKFEKQFAEALKNNKFKNVEKFQDFVDTIASLIDKYGRETHELYQKLLLIEALYAKVPQKWVFPLLEKVSSGESILDDLDNIPKNYHKQIQKVLDKINSMPVWDLFAIPMKNPTDLN